MEVSGGRAQGDGGGREPVPKRPCTSIPHLHDPSNIPLDTLLEALVSASHSDPSHLPLALHHTLLRQQSDHLSLQFLQQSLALASLLQHEAHRLRRQHAAIHNAASWPLTHDLTLKVFSLLDMHSLSQAAASCSLFNKAAMEPACYGDVDLTTEGLQVDDLTVARIIDRAGQHLRSLKLGSPPCPKKVHPGASKGFPVKPAVFGGEPQKKPMYCLSKCCLLALSEDNGSVGAMLKTLHLVHIDGMDSTHLCKAIAVCPGLTDLEIVGLSINMRMVLQSVTSHCHDMKRLFIQPPKTGSANQWRSCGPDSIRTLSCNQMVQGCPNITSLSLRGLKLPDRKVKFLLKGLQQLTEVDFSGADLLTGSFLRELIGCGEQQLESLILRDCMRLKEVEVEALLFSLSSGECKRLRHLDVSNKFGLAALDCYDRRWSISEEALWRVRKDRPELELFAYFPDDKSSSDCETMSMISSFGDSDESGPLRPSFQSSDYVSSDTSISSSSSSSDNNDHGNYYEEEDEDDDTQFMSPCDHSEGENAVFHVDSASASSRSDAAETGPFLP